MRSRLSNQFLINYLIAFLLSLLAAASVFLFLSFADGAISKNLMKNVYPAKLLMKDDYSQIDSDSVVKNGGGIQIINEEYQVVYSKGLSLIDKNQLTTGELTDFLIQSKAKGIPYSIDILYNSNQRFWLVVVFPTSIRLDFSMVYNREAASKDMGNVAGVFAAVALLYMLMLGVFSFILSRITSSRITVPLKKLCEGTTALREGDYSARVSLNLKNEFKELQDTFNDMAERIENETSLRKKAEEDQRQMILDISHDLKNPLSSVVGYAELCLKSSKDLDEEIKGYLDIIHRNSRRASTLLTQLFEMYKLDSPLFALKLHESNICEYLRQVCAEFLPVLDQAGFKYEFNIPEEGPYAMIDVHQLNRVFENLVDNAIRYNPVGTTVNIELTVEGDQIYILFEDDGIGIPSSIVNDIFKPFVRGDNSRNSEKGGSGLGLSIAQRIAELHGGSLKLGEDNCKGSSFRIYLPI